MEIQNCNWYVFFFFYSDNCIAVYAMCHHISEVVIEIGIHFYYLCKIVVTDGRFCFIILLFFSLNVSMTLLHEELP